VAGLGYRAVDVLAGGSTGGALRRSSAWSCGPLSDSHERTISRITRWSPSTARIFRSIGATRGKW